MEVSVNEKQRLFVIPCGGGYSCMGFDVVFNHCMEMMKRIKTLGFLRDGQCLPTISEAERGTVKQYNQYRELVALVGTRKIGTWFDFETPTAVRRVLERYRREGGRLRLFYGDRRSGRCWMEENDVVGRVGRSTGTLQIPLLIEDGEYGGPGILDSCIVRILDADSRVELYQHRLFHLPEMEIREVGSDLAAKGYSHGVWAKSNAGLFENYANFKSLGKAAQYVAFMSGECCEKPH